MQPEMQKSILQMARGAIMEQRCDNRIGSSQRGLCGAADGDGLPVIVSVLPAGLL